MKPMDFFVWQDGRGVNGQAIDVDPNAARRKKTRFHGTLWEGIGIKWSPGKAAMNSGERHAQRHPACSPTTSHE
jgi:hypothetical protein